MRKVYLAWLSMFLLGLPAWAGTVVGVDTLNPGSIGGNVVDSSNALAVAWYQNVGITGSVRVNFQTNLPDTSGTFYAYLTGVIGTGTSPADEIANTTFTSPSVLDGPVWIDLFDQINLGAGLYYLTIGSLDSTSGAWSNTDDPTVTQAPGFSLGDGSAVQFWASGSPYVDTTYLPASSFSPGTTVAEGLGGQDPNLMFDVSVPEPATIWLLGGALSLTLLRRKRSV
jgi:hypothetical protein